MLDFLEERDFLDGLDSLDDLDSLEGLEISEKFASGGKQKKMRSIKIDTPHFLYLTGLHSIP